MIENALDNHLEYFEVTMNVECTKTDNSDMYNTSMYPITQFYMNSSVAAAAATAAGVGDPVHHTNIFLPRGERNTLAVTSVGPSSAHVHCEAGVDVNRFPYKQERASNNENVGSGGSKLSVGVARQFCQEASESTAIKTMKQSETFAREEEKLQFSSGVQKKNPYGPMLQETAKSLGLSSEKGYSIVPKPESIHYGREGASYMTGECAMNILPDKYLPFSSSSQSVKDQNVHPEKTATSSDRESSVTDVDQAASPTLASQSSDKNEDLNKNENASQSNPSFKCQSCELEFAHKSLLAKHYVVHLNAGKAQLHCALCNTTFTRLDHLKRHFRSHTGEKPYKCGHCELAFARRDHLKKHIITHTGEKPYKCTICSSAFTRSDHLNKHKRIHTGEKLWNCTFCSTSFTHSDQLKKHLMTHMQGKPHKCNLCPSAFSRSDHLNKHKRTVHANTAKSLVCEVCDATFTLSDNLEEHRLIHAGENM